MKRIAFWGLFVILLYVFQSSVLSRVAIKGITAEILLLFVVSFAFLRGARLGVLMGFCVGIMEDLLAGGFFGVHAFNYTVFGLACGQLSSQVFKEQFFLPVLASIVATVINYCSSTVFVELLGYRFNPLLHAEYTLLPLLGCQIIFAYPIHYLTALAVGRMQEET